MPASGDLTFGDMFHIRLILELFTNCACVFRKFLIIKFAKVAFSKFLLNIFLNPENYI